MLSVNVRFGVVRTVEEEKARLHEPFDTQPCFDLDAVPAKSETVRKPVYTRTTVTINKPKLTFADYCAIEKDSTTQRAWDKALVASSLRHAVRGTKAARLLGNVKASVINNLVKQGVAKTKKHKNATFSVRIEGCPCWLHIPVKALA